MVKEKLRRRYNDAPSRVDVRTSILQLRLIFPEATDEAFANWYDKRYGVRASAIVKLLKETKENAGSIQI